MPPFIVSIEGNIGSGKSTLVNNLKDITHIDNIPVVFLQEPVSIWQEIKDNHGYDIIEKFYSNQQKYAFPFQMLAYISRLTILKDAINNNPNSIIITERCINTDKNIFCEMLYEDKKIEDVNYSIYNKWFYHFIDNTHINAYIYIETSPDICLKRIRKRNRAGEDIPIKYLERCHNKHDEWLNNNNYNTLTFNGNMENTEENITIWKQQICDWIKYSLPNKSANYSYIHDINFTYKVFAFIIIIYCFKYLA